MLASQVFNCPLQLMFTDSKPHAKVFALTLVTMGMHLERHLRHLYSDVNSQTHVQRWPNAAMRNIN